MTLYLIPGAPAGEALTVDATAGAALADPPEFTAGDVIAEMIVSLHDGNGTPVAIDATAVVTLKIGIGTTQLYTKTLVADDSPTSAVWASDFELTSAAILDAAASGARDLTCELEIATATETTTIHFDARLLPQLAAATAFDQLIDIHLDVEASHTRALLESATDGAVRNAPLELIAGDVLGARLHFHRRTSPGTLARVRLAAGSVLTLAARPFDPALGTSVLFTATSFTEDSAGAWTGVLFLTAAALTTYLGSQSERPLLMQVTIADPSPAITRRTLQWPATLRAEIPVS